jgi:hypothetical protein
VTLRKVQAYKPARLAAYRAFTNRKKSVDNTFDIVLVSNFSINSAVLPQTPPAQRVVFLRLFSGLLLNTIPIQNPLSMSY